MTDVDERTRKAWRAHFDKVAQLRVQTPEELVVRREKLAAAICSYLQSVATKSAPPARRGKRAVSSNVTRTRGLLKNTWHCTDAWITVWDKFLLDFGHAPSKYELTRYLGIPPREMPVRVPRKKEHASSAHAA